MIKLISVRTRGGEVDPAVLIKLNAWAADKPDDVYIIPEPREIARAQSDAQRGGYWARNDDLSKQTSEYTPYQYHGVMMKRAGYGEFIHEKNGDVTFLPITSTGLSMEKYSVLYDKQDEYVLEYNDGKVFESWIELRPPEFYKGIVK